MAWEENSCISLNMQLIAILSRIGVDSVRSVCSETFDEGTEQQYPFKTAKKVPSANSWLLCGVGACKRENVSTINWSSLSKGLQGAHG